MNREPEIQQAEPREVGVLSEVWTQKVIRPSMGRRYAGGHLLPELAAFCSLSHGDGCEVGRCTCSWPARWRSGAIRLLLLSRMQCPRPIRNAGFREKVQRRGKQDGLSERVQR